MLGYSKCLKKFVRDESNKLDYSGYGIQTERNIADHRRHVEEIQGARTATERSTLESTSGVRYTELLRLPYFDPIKSHVVDVMHNMLLGSAKHIFTVWISEGIPDDDKIKRIDTAINEMTVPSEVGRVTKSMFLYKTMKAAEWKNWVVVFSLYSLKKVLSKRHYNLWQLFVRASNIFINSSITMEEVNLGHELIVMYCKQFQAIYGSRYCTPNMHMHTHIKSCILEFGPTYGFWCFSFERYNFILGSYSTNNHALTITLMKKFVNGLRIESSYERLGIEELPPLEEFKLRDNETLGDTTIALDYARRNPLEVPFESLSNIFTIVTVPKLARLSDEDMMQIHVALQTMIFYSDKIEVLRYYHSYSKVRLGRQILTVYRRNAAGKDCNVIVKMHNNECAARLLKIAKINCSVQRQNGAIDQSSALFVQVSFFRHHPEKNWFGENSPMKLYDTLGDNNQFTPVHHILRKCTVTKAKQKLDQMDLAGGRRTIHKAYDIVYFVI